MLGIGIGILDYEWARSLDSSAGSHSFAQLESIEERQEGERKVTHWGTGRPSREFLYAADCAEGIFLAPERYDKPDPLNLGLGPEISIRELAAMVAELTGFKREFVWDASQPDSQPRRCLDTSRAKGLFGFEPRTTFEDGLRRAAGWNERQVSPSSQPALTPR